MVFDFLWRGERVCLSVCGGGAGECSAIYTLTYLIVAASLTLCVHCITSVSVCLCVGKCVRMLTLFPT